MENVDISGKKTYVVYAVMEKYQVELRELIFNNILQNGTKRFREYIRCTVEVRYIEYK